VSLEDLVELLVGELVARLVHDAASIFRNLEQNTSLLYLIAGDRAPEGVLIRIIIVYY